MGGIGMSELLVILVVVIVIFGAKRLPEIGSSLGKGINNFKRSLTEESEKPDDSSGKSSNRDS